VSAVTAAELDRLPRAARVKALWAAMSPAGRERAWAGLSEPQRVDAIKVLFDAREERDPVTAAGAFDAWQRETER